MRSVWRLVGMLVLSACAPSGPDSVVLVTVDTLRADRLGVYGHERARTPQIDALAAESLRFERAFAHSSSTLPSIVSLQTGVLPGEHLLYANLGALSPELETLATRLRPTGAASAAFLGSWILRPGRGLDRDFDRYTESWEAREGNRPQPESRAASLTDEAIAWLEERAPGDAIFLWVHYQEPHGPYEPPDPPPAASTGPELPRSADMSGIGAIPRYQWLGHGRLAEYEARYDGEIAEVDRHLGRLLEALRRRGILERSVLVFTADHGEAFGEEGLYCAHGEGLGEALLRVPLLLRAPGVVPGVRSDTVRLIDVAPTVLGLLGLPVDGLPGASLLDDLGDREVVAQVAGSKDRQWRSVRDGGLELVESRDGTEVRRLDPQAGDRPIRLAERRRLATRVRKLAHWPPPPVFPIPVAPEERELLRSMGYLD